MSGMVPIQQAHHACAAAPSPSLASEPLQWARVVWRRGTVPIWWGVNLQPLQKGLQAEVYIREKEPYRGTVTYFRWVRGWARALPPPLGQRLAGCGVRAPVRP